MRRVFFIATFLLFSSPAAADVTARYVNAKGLVTLVEVNDAGSARIGTVTRAEGAGPPDYSLFTPEGDFYIFHGFGGVKVVSWHVFNAVIDAQTAEMFGPEMLEIYGRKQKADKRPAIMPRRVGTARVAGWRGIEFIGALPDDPPSRNGEYLGVLIDKPAIQRIVISPDAKLLPLARAWLRFFRSRSSFYQFPSGKVDRTLAQLAMLAERGAPLQFGDTRLTSVSFEEIQDDRFTLPAQPLNPKEYRNVIGETGIGLSAAQPIPTDR